MSLLLLATVAGRSAGSCFGVVLCIPSLDDLMTGSSILRLVNSSLSVKLVLGPSSCMFR